MAKRKSLFDDKADEIQQLTFIIKQDLGTLNKQIAQLQEVALSVSLRFVSMLVILLMVFTRTMLCLSVCLSQSNEFDNELLQLSY